MRIANNTLIPLAILLGSGLILRAQKRKAGANGVGSPYRARWDGQTTIDWAALEDQRSIPKPVVTDPVYTRQMAERDIDAAIQMQRDRDRHARLQSLARQRNGYRDRQTGYEYNEDDTIVIYRVTGPWGKRLATPEVVYTIAENELEYADELIQDYIDKANWFGYEVEVRYYPGGEYESDLY